MNKTQRNFRKEMKKIAKEKQGEEVYSYVHENYTNFYSPPKRKKDRVKKLIKALFSLLILFLVGLGMAVATNNFKDFSSIKYNSVASNPLHKKISENVKYGERIGKQLNEYITYSANMYASAFQDERKKQEYLDTITTYQNEVHDIMEDVMNNNPPKDMADWYNTLVERCKNTSELLIHASNAVRNNDKQNDSKFRAVLNNLNILANQEMSQLKKMFDRTGIKWEGTDTGIRYWIFQ